jgi:hypothetical protein
MLTDKEARSIAVGIAHEDDTDRVVRLIQQGVQRGFELCKLRGHVEPCPNHQSQEVGPLTWEACAVCLNST